MQHSSNETSCLKFLDLFRDELLPLQGLLPYFLLDRSGMRADNKVVLDYLPGNTGDIRWLPGKHIDIRSQEGNERAFLFSSRVALIVKVPSAPASPAGTFFTIGVAALGLLLLELSGMSSTGAAHSEEVRFPDSLPEPLSAFPFLLLSLAGATASVASTVTASRYISS